TSLSSRRNYQRNMRTSSGNENRNYQGERSDSITSDVFHRKATGLGTTTSPRITTVAAILRQSEGSDARGSTANQINQTLPVCASLSSNGISGQWTQPS